MRILFYDDPPNVNTTLLTWTLAQELILRGHQVDYSKPHLKFAHLLSRNKYDWVRGGSVRSWDALKFARGMGGAKCHIHLEGLAYWRVGLESAVEAGYPNEFSSIQISEWKEHYKSWMSAAYESDSCSVNGADQIKAIEALFGGKKLPNCHKLSCGADRRIADALPIFDRKNFMLTISRLEPNKKVFLIAQGLALLTKRTDFELPPWYIIGNGDKNEMGRIAKFCIDNNIDVRFLGIIHGYEKWVWIKNARIMLSGWGGIQPAEALLCDTPVISFNHPYIVEMYDDSIWWANDNDPEDFAKALKHIFYLDDEPSIFNRVKEQAAYGKKKLLNGEIYACTQEQLAEKYEEIFYEI